MNQQATFTVYVYKYALTKGVYPLEVRKTSSNDLFEDASKRYTYYFLGKDCFLTLEEANAESEKMRLAKIKSLKKQVTKLEAIKFTT